MTPLRVVLCGARGRMGLVLTRVVGEAEDLRLVAAVEREGHPALGQDAGGVALTCDLEAALSAADVAVDFSAPASTVATAHACARQRVAAVLGTTGLDEAQRAAVGESARQAPLVFAPNMSVGANVLFRLSAEAHRLLGPAFAPAVAEIHHRHKQDAPSGTALRLGEAAGAPRASLVALRGGDVVGDHTVFFLGDGERLELTHRATSRDAFAQGALRAARWVVGRAPGLYTMSDVLA